MTPRTMLLALGSALIIITNGIVLVGVASNRSGEPESRVTLSERELGRPWKFNDDKENSGLSLTLKWRVPRPAAEYRYSFYGDYGGSPAWLDEKRMAELGFKVEEAKGDDALRQRAVMQSEREVLVVLQLAGRLWEDSVESARKRLADQESLYAASPQAKEMNGELKRARDALAREENAGSRLFAIDVGNDLASLREKYPDRSRYLILRAKLRLHTISGQGRPVVTGYLDDLSVRQINVPHALRAAFEGMPERDTNPYSKEVPFTATVAFGQRLEPWIEALSAGR